jgi:hypothetical protein
MFLLFIFNSTITCHTRSSSKLLSLVLTGTTRIVVKVVEVMTGKQFMLVAKDN